MKKVALSDTVSVEMSRRLCVERVHLRIYPRTTYIYLQCHYQFVSKDILWSPDFSPFLQAFFATFRDFPCQNRPGAIGK